jgi:Tol biopolymer transport system component
MKWREKSDIWRLSAEGGEAENLTNTPNFHEVDPDWSPNGQLIVY